MPVRRTGRDHLQVEYYSADADVTFNVKDHGQHIRVDTTAWTMARSIILDDLSAIDGDYFRVSTAVATFDVNVRNHDGTLLFGVAGGPTEFWFFGGNWQVG